MASCVMDDLFNKFDDNINLRLFDIIFNECKRRASFSIQVTALTSFVHISFDFIANCWW